MRDLPPGVEWGIWEIWERNNAVWVFRVVVLGGVAPEGVGDGEREGAGGGEDYARHVEVTCEEVGPTKEEVIYDG